MSEPAFFSVDRAAFDALHRRVAQGDRDAVDELAGLWADVDGQLIACGLCNAPTAELPRFALTLPEKDGIASR